MIYVLKFCFYFMVTVEYLRVDSYHIMLFNAEQPDESLSLISLQLPVECWLENLLSFSLASNQ